MSQGHTKASYYQAQYHRIAARRGKVNAAQDVSMEVHQAKAYGFLGTTIGILHPAAGHVSLFGQPVTPGRMQVLRPVGALVGDFDNRDKITVFFPETAKGRALKAEPSWKLGGDSATFVNSIK